MKNILVLMAGGSGTRFWPLSTLQKPKQLLKLTSSKTMLRESTDRVKKLFSAKNQWVVTTEALSRAVKKELPGASIVSEPEGRNTMAAACLAVWQIAVKNPEATIALLPADAFIGDAAVYQRTLHAALSIARNEKGIVCIGIKPTFAATGYGYIEAAPHLHEAVGWHRIQRFVEKPDAIKAQEFFESGRFVWNAGIFIFLASVFKEEVRRLAPEYATVMDQLFKKRAPSKAEIKRAYRKLPRLPIDIALMEKTERGILLSGDFGWNDVGSWPSLAEVLPANSEAGLILEASGHWSTNSSGNIVRTDGAKFVALLGVKDLIIVETAGALLVCHKDQAQKIKEVVASLQKNKKFKKLI